MTPEEITQLQDYCRALERERDEYKADLEKSLGVVNSILDILGIEPENMDKVELRSIIKKGSGLFTQALIYPSEFAKKFEFTKHAADLALKYNDKK